MIAASNLAVSTHAQTHTRLYINNLLSRCNGISFIFFQMRIICIFKFSEQTDSCMNHFYTTGELATKFTFKVLRCTGICQTWEVASFYPKETRLIPKDNYIKSATIPEDCSAWCDSYPLFAVSVCCWSCRVRCFWWGQQLGHPPFPARMRKTVHVDTAHLS